MMLDKKWLVRLSLVSGMILLVSVLWYLNEVVTILEQRQNGSVGNEFSASLNTGLTMKAINLRNFGGNNHRGTPVPAPVPVLEDKQIAAQYPKMQVSLIAVEHKSTSVPTPISPFRQHGKLLSVSDPSIRQVIFGLAQKGSDESFAVFIGSLRKHDKNATDAVIFMNAPISQRTLTIARKFNAVIVEYELGKLLPRHINNYHASSLRWVLFHQFLLEHNSTMGSRYDKIMFTDVRDVAFAGDPFKHLPMGKSYVFQEGVGIGTPIVSCGWNSGWIKDCMGQKILNAVQNNGVICSGVSLMSFPQGREYVRLMSTIIVGASDMSRHFPTCERNGVDQGVHNVIVHLGLVPGLEVRSEADFPVVNIQSSPAYNVAGMRLENIQLLTFNAVTQSVGGGQPMAVVHQYDRVASLTMQLMRMYVYWKNYDDAMSLWQNEAQCSGYNTFIGDDLFRGMCDIGGSRVFSPEQCCQLCSSMSKCNGFAYSESVCYFKSCTISTVPPNTVAAMESAKSSPNNWKKKGQFAQRTSLEGLVLTAFK